MTTDRELIQQHSKSFALAAKLLRASARTRAEALYTWCRTADDLIDLAIDQHSAQTALLHLKQDVDAVYAGHAIHSASGDALRRAVEDCGIPRQYPEELLAGMEMDVNGVSFEGTEQLLLYCHRVAGVVGLMMCHALGISDDKALSHAAHLGIAMQLTNIARDIAEDWQRGRRYLPAEWFAGGPPEPGSTWDDTAWSDPLRTCLQIAEHYYQSGAAGLKYLANRDRLAIHTAAKVYQAIGQCVVRLGYRPSAGRAVVSNWKKWRIVTSCFITGLPKLLLCRVVVRQPQTVCPFTPLFHTDLKSRNEEFKHDDRNPLLA